MPTKLQKRASAIMKANPHIKPSEALLSAGYSEKSVGSSVPRLLDSKGLANLRDVYQYELIKKGITPKLLAKLTKTGLKDKDTKVVLSYMESAKKDLEISQDTPDTAIQINLGEDISKLAD